MNSFELFALICSGDAKTSSLGLLAPQEPPCESFTFAVAQCKWTLVKVMMCIWQTEGAEWFIQRWRIKRRDHDAGVSYLQRRQWRRRPWQQTLPSDRCYGPRWTTNEQRGHCHHWSETSQSGAACVWRACVQVCCGGRRCCWKFCHQRPCNVSYCIRQVWTGLYV